MHIELFGVYYIDQIPVEGINKLKVRIAILEIFVKNLFKHFRPHKKKT